MNHLFSSDSIFFRGMSKVFDVVLLSTVFALACLPIVTIGPAITALYYSTVKCIRRGRGYVVKEFFTSFKRDFRLAFYMEMFLFIAGYILYINLKMSMEIPNFLLSVLRYVYVGLGVLVIFVSIYAFPFISRFQLSLKVLLQLALFLSIRHLLTTLISIILLFGAFALVYLSYGAALFFVPVILIFLISILMEKHLKACMKLVQNGGSGKDRDEWYLE